ncbi:MAG: hypothetical protein ACREO3_10425 [Arenimonas sp.]
MPNPIEACLAKVKQAEIDCERRGLAARKSWADLKQLSKDAATPWRIAAVGAISGFIVGRGSPGGGGSGETMGAKIFGTLAQSLLTMLSAGATAGVAASAAADAAAEATVDATAEAVEQLAEEKGVVETTEP